MERGKTNKADKAAPSSSSVGSSKQEEAPEVLEDIPQFLCTFCPKTYSINSLNGLDQHVSEAHQSEIYCCKCKEVFKDINNKVKHEKSCNNQQPFYKKMEFIECVFCKHLYRRDKLRKHVELEHNDDEDLPRKVSKRTKSKSQKNTTATSILDILTNGNKVSLTQASLTLKEKILNFNKKLNSLNDEGKVDEAEASKTIKIEESEEELDIKPPNDVPVPVVPDSKINILGLKHKLKISLKNDNE